jgi:hypothetical protein
VPIGTDPLSSSAYEILGAGIEFVIRRLAYLARRFGGYYRNACDSTPIRRPPVKLAGQELTVSKSSSPGLAQRYRRFGYEDNRAQASENACGG